jgi:hypothetical protein
MYRTFDPERLDKLAVAIAAVLGLALGAVLPLVASMSS